MDAFIAGIVFLAMGWLMAQGVRPIRRVWYILGVIMAGIAGVFLLMGLLAVVDLWIHREEIIAREGFLAEPIVLGAIAFFIFVIFDGTMTIYREVRSKSFYNSRRIWRKR